MLVRSSWRARLVVRERREEAGAELVDPPPLGAQAGREAAVPAAGVAEEHGPRAAAALKQAGSVLVRVAHVTHLAVAGRVLGY